jgi:hypothetical protein
MATVGITNITQSSMQWQIQNLSNPFTSQYYMSAGLSLSSFSNGASSVNAWATTSSYTGTTSTYWTFKGSLSAGTTYTVYGFARAANGLYYQAGSRTFTTQSASLPKLSTPTLSGSSSTTDSIAVTMSAVTGATYYEAQMTNGNWSGGSSRTKQFTGLSPSTSYGFKFKCSGSGYQDSDWSANWIYLSTANLPTLSTPSLNTIDSTETTIYVQINPVSNANRYTFALNNGNSIDTPNTYATFTGLNSSTSYGVRWKARDIYGNYQDSPYSSYYYISTKTPLPPPGNLSGLYVSNITSSSATGYWNSTTGATSYDVLLRRGTTTIVNTSTTATSRSFSGLLDSSTHTLTVTPRNSSGTGGNQSVNFTTLSPYTRPSNWYWNTTELNAMNGQGAFSTLTATRWNAFLDRVELFINYFNGLYGHSVPSVVSTANGGQNCKVSSGGILYAAKFNHVRFAIGSMNSTGLTDYSPGQIVYGWYFIRLQDRLNEIS